MHQKLTITGDLLPKGLFNRIPIGVEIPTPILIPLNSNLISIQISFPLYAQIPYQITISLQIT